MIKGILVQFRDLKKQYIALKNEIDNAVFDVINSTNFIIGKQVSELEEELASYVGRKHCISCANGTDALVLALIVMGVKKGDAVFVPDFTYIATASSVSFVGATPIFVDIDLDTYNMSDESLEVAIKRVKDNGELIPKAIIPVDLFGLPADYDKILKIAKTYDLKVIEDAAQGFGGRINSKIACSFGDISCTSFFPAKPLGCYVDGGAVFTDDDNTDDILRSLRANGKSKVDKYDNVMIGMNSRLDTIQAAILKVKFNALVNYELEAVNNAYIAYNQRLKSNYRTPIIPKGFYSSFAQYTILCDDKVERDNLQKKLKDNNIPTMVYYPRGMHEQKCFGNLTTNGFDFSNSIEATKRVLSLPMHPYITNEEINGICDIMLN